MKTFAQRLKEVRAEHDMTQTQMAEFLGVAFCTVNRWERGRFTPHHLTRAFVLERLLQLKKKRRR